MLVDEQLKISLHNAWRGRTCYVLGNGPSLKEVDLHSLRYPTFGTNRIYLSGYQPDYYVCVNPLVLQQFNGEIANLDVVGMFIPRGISWVQEPCSPVFEIDTSLPFPHFEVRPDLNQIWEGHTVTYVALQLAYFMGFQRVILLGVDHNYGDPKVPNLEAVATGVDEYHFHPEYFTDGVRWNYPDLQRSELAYSLARAAFEADGREIINCSHKTRLTVFPVIPFNHIENLSMKVSAIVSAYKCEEFIEGCLMDLAQQTIVDQLEVVIVLQTGSEEEKIVFDVIGRDDCNINAKVIWTDDIPTVYHAWNLGIKAASGKYITNANTDDRHHPKSFEVLSSILDGNPGIDLVYHDQFITWTPNQTYQEFVKNLDETSLVSGRREGEPGIFRWADHDLEMLSEGCYVGPQPMWRASLHQAHGYFIDEWKSAGDYEYWLRVAKDDNFFHVEMPLGLYLARTDGIELSDPFISHEESSNAIIYNQHPGGASFKPIGEFIKVGVGGRYVIHYADQFLEQMGKFMEMVRSCLYTSTDAQSAESVKK